MLHPQQPSPERDTTHGTKAEELVLSSPSIPCSSVDLFVITERLKAHNESVGLGATLGRLILGIMHERKQLPPDSGVSSEKLKAHAFAEEKSHRQSRREQFEAEITPTLAAIGLKVGPINGGWGLPGAVPDPGLTMLSLHIEDAQRFIGYLAALAPNTISRSQREGLNAFYLTLCRQITTDYDLSSSDDRLLTLVSAAGEMVAHYERLDLPTRRLKNYLEAIRGKYLRSYVEVERLQLDKPLEKGDGYRLLWHRDTIPERLQADWNRVLGLLVTLAGNESARPVYDTACKTARQAIDKSITEVSQWTAESGAAYMANKQSFLNILNAVKLRMSEF